MKRNISLVVVSTLGLVASADAAVVSRSLDFVYGGSESIVYDGLGAFNSELMGQQGPVAWMNSVVDFSRVEVSAGTELHQWFPDPNDPYYTELEAGGVSMSLSFTLSSRRWVHVFSNPYGDTSYAELSGPDGLLIVFGAWDGWFEPGNYSITAHAEQGDGFIFSMNIPAPAGLLLLTGGALVCPRRRRVVR